MKSTPFLAMLTLAFLFSVSTPAQTNSVTVDVEAPVLDDSGFAFEPPDALLSQSPAIPAPPLPNRLEAAQTRMEALDPSAQEYRFTVQAIGKDRHQFIHCRLKNGKVLTGVIRDVSDRGFSLHSNALGGTYVFYNSLAETPRRVPAVGTRIKQGAQWTALGLGIAVAIPLAIPLCLILYPLVIAGVIQD